jgi:hypothetical protein
VGVHHLDVPEAVAIKSQADMFTGDLLPGCGHIGGGFYILGSVSLPVFRQLVPANQPQVHLGTDLGIYPRHTNVIIYNGGVGVGTATVDFRAACDDALIERRVVTLQPDSVVQVIRLSDDPNRICQINSSAEPTTRYVTVTMDQPGFSHVMTVSDASAYPSIGVTSGGGP